MNRSWQFWDGNRTPSGNKILTHTQYLPRHQLSSNETGADAKNPKTKISRWQKVVRTWLILWCWGYYKSIFGCLGILRVSRQFQASASLLHEGNFVIAFQVDDLSLISESKLKGSSELGLSAVRERSGIATKIQQGINNWAYMSLYIHIIYILYIYYTYIYMCNIWYTFWCRGQGRKIQDNFQPRNSQVGAPFHSGIDVHCRPSGATWGRNTSWRTASWGPSYWCVLNVGRLDG